jgi:hypothetical protein
MVICRRCSCWKNMLKHLLAQAARLGFSIGVPDSRTRGAGDRDEKTFGTPLSCFKSQNITAASTFVDEANIQNK